MEQFKYLVKDKKGESKSGIIEASDVKQASSLLHERGMVVIRIESKGKRFNPIDFLFSFRPINLTELSTFTRQIATMVSSGLSLVDSLLLLEKQTINPKLKEAISEIIRDVQGGGSLASAMAKHQKVFSHTYVGMIKAAESSGNLDKVLTKLADNLERESEVRSKIVGAMVYPAILLFVMVLVIISISYFVLPRFKELFASSHVELPLPTVILIAISEFLNNTWFIIPIVALLVFYFSYRMNRISELKTYYDFVVMRIPYIGEINKSFSLAQVTRTLGLLVGSGVPILEALKTSSEVATNNFHKEAFKEAAQSVEKGVPLSVPLGKNPIFPPVISQMVAVGEETGKLEDVLGKVSDYFEIDASHKVKNFTAALGPIIIILLSGVVLFILMSVILPIYRLSSGVGAV